jgi:hypothetical protein
VKLCTHCGSATRGVKAEVFVCLEKDGKFVYVIVLYFNFFDTGYDLVRLKCIFWEKVLVRTTFGIDTNAVVSSADSW